MFKGPSAWAWKSYFVWITNPTSALSLGQRNTLKLKRRTGDKISQCFLSLNLLWLNLGCLASTPMAGLSAFILFPPPPPGREGANRERRNTHHELDGFSKHFMTGQSQRPPTSTCPLCFSEIERCSQIRAWSHYIFRTFNSQNILVRKSSCYLPSPNLHERQGKSKSAT